MSRAKFDAVMPPCLVRKAQREAFDRLASSSDHDLADHMRAAFDLYLRNENGLEPTNVDQ